MGIIEGFFLKKIYEIFEETLETFRNREVSVPRGSTVLRGYLKTNKCKNKCKIYDLQLIVNGKIVSCQNSERATKQNL